MPWGEACTLSWFRLAIKPVLNSSAIELGVLYLQALYIWITKSCLIIWRTLQVPFNQLMYITAEISLERMKPQCSTGQIFTQCQMGHPFASHCQWSYTNHIRISVLALCVRKHSTKSKLACSVFVAFKHKIRVVVRRTNNAGAWRAWPVAMVCRWQDAKSESRF